MKCDIVLAGVGGQGVLSVATAIATCAMQEGFRFKQSEVHGMAQRGGAVMASLRISREEIASDLIPMGTASMILSMEPMESLRYLPYLSTQGRLVTSANPVRNIPDYPALEVLLETIRTLPGAILVDAEKLARDAGSVRATNMVVVGAAMQFLPFRSETVENAVVAIFASKGGRIVETNLRALRAGRAASDLMHRSQP